MHLAQIALTAGVYAGQVKPETPLHQFLIDPPELDAELEADELEEDDDDDADAFDGMPVDGIRYVTQPERK